MHAFDGDLPFLRGAGAAGKGIAELMTAQTVTLKLIMAEDRVGTGLEG